MSEALGVMIDAIAAVLTPDVIRPFDVPRRPFQLGMPDAYCIRPGYVARDEPGLGLGLGSDTLAVRPTLTSIEGRLAGIFGRELVVASHGEIERHADPARLVDSLARRLVPASVLLLSTSIRALAVTGDHPGPPANPAHLREWTFPELHAFLDVMGLDVLFGGVCADDPHAGTCEIGVLVAIRER